MTEIDQTDLLGFLRIRAWNARQEQDEKNHDPALLTRCDQTLLLNQFSRNSARRLSCR